MSLTKKAVSLTLRKDLLEWADAYAKEQHLNRSELMEKALQSLRNEEVGKQLEASFRRVRADQEMKALAQMGTEDFLQMIDDTTG